MNITKELLDDFSVIAMFFSTGKNDINCILKKTNNGIYLFNFTGNYVFAAGEKIELRISFRKKNEVSVSKADIKVIESGLNYVLGTITDFDENISELIAKIHSLEFNDEKYGRRKENRIAIGKENSALFGLSSVEQKLLSKTAKIIQPCAVLDASIHGICIVTPFDNQAFKNVENFNICLSFINPEQTVILQAHKVHSKLNTTNSRTFATISCQLLEPINYIWKERVIKMIENEMVDK